MKNKKGAYFLAATKFWLCKSHGGLDAVSGEAGLAGFTLMKHGHCVIRKAGDQWRLVEGRNLRSSKRGKSENENLFRSYLLN